MASITFRLRASNHVGAINMDGKVITVREVQVAVAEKLKAPEEEIRIFNADSTDLLHPDEELLAYAVVDVVRQAHTGRLTYAASRAAKTSAMNAMPSRTATSVYATPAQSGSGPNAELTEEERLAQLQAEVTLDTGIDQVHNTRFRRGGGPGRGRGGGMGGGEGGRGGGMMGGMGGGMGGGFNPMDAKNFGPPPKTYICHNCGKAGHYIQDCPSMRANGGKHVRVLTLPVGIPESMLVECTMDDPAPKFITRDHRIVKRRMDAAAFVHVALPTDIVAADSPTATDAQDGSGAKEGTAAGGDGEGGAAAKKADGDAVPKRLRCMVDNVAAVEAYRAECCGRLICKTCYDDLIQKAMKAMHDMDAEPLTCPGCEEPLIIDDFAPAEEERKEIAALASSRKRPRA